MKKPSPVDELLVWVHTIVGALLIGYFVMSLGVVVFPATASVMMEHPPSVKTIIEAGVGGVLLLLTARRMRILKQRQK